ncbi:hypothetical protein [Nocardioides speluncae]|uniref:hypothetical protein n=1 Tax=Nocardioides speluncae TaxID=2670337 RepID=UPI000D6855FB|nr:hypothetical protein [Nocardioides speluncae]
MTLQTYEFRDPSALINDLAARVPMAPGTAYLVLVVDPATEQRIVLVERLDTPAVLYDCEAAREELRERVELMPVPDTWPTRHAVMTVVVRPGLCVFGPNEAHWFSAWRYANHLSRAHTGDVILVTEHGWTDFMTKFAGRTPALSA